MSDPSQGPADAGRTTRPDSLVLAASIFEHLNEAGFMHFTLGQIDVVLTAAGRIVGGFPVARTPAAEDDVPPLVRWLLGGKVGASAIAMAWRLAPGNAKGAKYLPGMGSLGQECATPADSADFGRCVGLLEAVPELRPHLHLMSSVSATWGRLVARWDHLESLYRDSNRPANWQSLIDRALNEIRSAKA